MGDYYTKKHLKFIIFLHLLIGIPYLLISAFLCGLGGSCYDIFYFILPKVLYELFPIIFPIIIFLNPIITALLQEKKDVRYGYLLIINFILIVLFFIDFFRKTLFPYSKLYSGMRGEFILKGIFLDPLNLILLFFLIIHISMFRKMIKFKKHQK